MAKTKTHETAENVEKFIINFSNSQQKIEDSFRLIQLMKKATGQEPKMWGPSIVGFGNYHYKYASGHEGDAPLLGFSPRNSAISLYVYTGFEEHKHLLEDLGKFKMGKACIYVKKLDDINLPQLNKLMKASIKYVKETYPLTNEKIC